MSAAAATPERQHHNVTLAVLVTGALAYALSQTMIHTASSGREACMSCVALCGLSH